MAKLVLDTEQNIKSPKLVLDTDKSNVPTRSNLLTNPIETIGRSASEFAGGILTALVDPVGTVKSIDTLIQGVAEKAIPGVQKHEFAADAMGDFFKNRYGSFESVKKTALEDPVGFASDLSIFLTGGGAALTKAGQVSKVSKLAKAGQIISTTGKAIDPISSAMTAVGKTVSLTKGLKVAPFANKLDNPVISAAKRLDIEVPASAKTTSKIVPQAEALIQKGIFGDKLQDVVNTAMDKLVKAGDDIIQRTGKADDLSAAGKVISDAAQEFKDRALTVREALYDKANFDKRAKFIRVNPVNSLEVINDVVKQRKQAGNVLGSFVESKTFKNLKNSISRKTVLPQETRFLESSARNSTTLIEFLNKNNQFDKKFLTQVFKQVKESQPSAVDIRSALKELNKSLFNKSDPVLTGNKAELSRLAAAMQDDLQLALNKANPELARDINRANAFYRLSLQELNSHFGQTILKFKDQPDKILPHIIKNTTSESDVKRIYRMIGQDNAKQVQAAFMRDLFNKSKNNNNTLSASKLSNQIDSFGNKLNKILDLEQVQVLRDIKEVSRGLAKSGTITGGSQTAFLSRLFVLGGLFGSGNVVAGLKLLGLEYFANKFITSQKGQKILSTGDILTGETGKIIQRQAQNAGTISRTGRALDIVTPNN